MRIGDRYVIRYVIGQKYVIFDYVIYVRHYKKETRYSMKHNASQEPCLMHSHLDGESTLPHRGGCGKRNRGVTERTPSKPGAHLDDGIQWPSGKITGWGEKVLLPQEGGGTN